jgi:hypothetical protein
MFILFVFIFVLVLIKYLHYLIYPIKTLSKIINTTHHYISTLSTSLTHKMNKTYYYYYDIYNYLSI